MTSRNALDSVSQTLMQAQRNIARGQSLVSQAQWLLAQSPDLPHLQKLLHRLPLHIRERLAASPGRLDPERTQAALAQAWKSTFQEIYASRGAVCSPCRYAGLSPRRGSYLI